MQVSAAYTKTWNFAHLFERAKETPLRPDVTAIPPSSTMQRPTANARRARRYPHDPAARSRARRLTSMESHRLGVTNFVHIGVVVEDLDSAPPGTARTAR